MFSSLSSWRIPKRVYRTTLAVVVANVILGAAVLVVLAPRSSTSYEIAECPASLDLQQYGSSHFLSASLNAGRQATNILDQVPDAFIENRGQWVPSAKFATRRSGLSAWFTDNSIGLIHSSSEGQNPSALVWLEFERSAEDVALEGENLQPTQYSFYLGNDPARWRSGVPCYSSIIYRGLYRGVDLRVRNAGRFLEYDLLLAPGVDPSGIVIRAEGIASMHVDDNGSLVIKTRAGTITQRVPTSWYVMSNGNTKPVQCTYRILDKCRYTFEIKRWNPLLVLVIDPQLNWSTYLGGTGTETPAPKGVVLSSFVTDEVVYVAATTTSMNFPVTPGAHDSIMNGPSDIVLAVLNPSRVGNAQLVSSTYLGGSGEDIARAAYVTDIFGNIVVVGASNSTNYPVTSNAFDPTHNGGLDVVLSVFDSLNRLTYSSYLGGSLDDVSNSAVEGPRDQSTIVGHTRSTNFPTTAGAFDRTHNGLFDGFALRLNYNLPPSSQLTWSTFLGGALNDFANDVAVDSAGKVTTAGNTESSNFPVRMGFDMTYNGNGDGFITQLDPAQTGDAQLVGSTYLGGSQIDQITGLTVQTTGRAVVVGFTNSSNFPTTPGVFDPTYNGGFDLFVAGMGNLSPFSTLTFGTFVGGSADEFSGGIGHTSDDNVVVVGNTSSSNFPTVRGDSVRRGPTDGVVVTLSPAGGFLFFASLIGALNRETIDANYVEHRHLPLDGAARNDVYILGQTTSSDFVTTPGAFQTMLRGPSDLFVARLRAIPTSVWENRDNVPSTFALHQNYPNPFNPSTRIRFSVAPENGRTGEGENVVLKVFDVLGRQVATLVNENLRAGSYEATFDATGLSSGTYIYRLTSGGHSLSRKLLLTK
jgi:hypothetical protein